MITHRQRSERDLRAEIMCAADHPSRARALCEEVIASGDGVLIALAATHVPGADTSRLQGAVLQRGVQASAIGLFACLAPEVDMIDLGAHVIARGLIRQAFDSYEITREDVDVHVLWERLVDMSILAHVISEQSEFDFHSINVQEMMESFLENVDGYDITQCQQAVIDTGHLEVIGDFAHLAQSGSTGVDGIDVPLLQSIVVASEDVSAITRFAAFISGADVAPLQEIVLERGDAWDIATLLEHCEDADVDRCNAALDARGEDGDLARSEMIYPPAALDLT